MRTAGTFSALPLAMTPYTRRKLLVATVGVGTISYAIACSSPTSGNLPSPPEDASFDAPVDAGPPPTSGNLMPPPPRDAEPDADAAVDADADANLDAASDG